MSPSTVLLEALTSLRKNAVRTSLSVLGIVIGVASVIAMVAVGAGAKARVEREIAALGDDWMVIGFWGIQRGGARRQTGVPPNLAADDADAIARECSAVRAATPSNRMNMQVVSAFANYQTTVQGAYPSFFNIRRWSPVSGRLFDGADAQSMRRVCCIGQTAARELFGPLDPVGQTVRVNNRITFEVIGLLGPKGTDTNGRDNDDVIVFPWDTFQRQVAGDEIAQTMYAAARAGVDIEVAKRQVRSCLRQRHRLADDEDDDFRIIDRSLSAEASAETTRTFNRLLMAIASISLLVGGVGIMNITLVSVTERTREIGTRMAIGANAGHILAQFLAEAVLLCALGGIVGFVAGVGVAELVRWKLEWETVISYWMAGVAIAFSTAIGVFFGFYPAWRASRLDPIEALRYE